MQKLDSPKSDVDSQPFNGPDRLAGRNVVIINSVELNILLAMKDSAYLLAVLLLLGVSGCGRDKVVKETRAVDTPAGKIEMKVTTYPAGSKNIGVVVRELTQEEKRDLERDADRSRDFIRRYAPDAHNDLLLDLDAAFAGWLRSSDPSRESAHDVERMIGAAYGRLCIEKLGMRWAVIQDDIGIDTALVRSDPEARSYPFTSVRYRIEDKKTDFIYGLYVALEDIIKRTKEANQPPQTTPGSCAPLHV